MSALRRCGTLTIRITIVNRLLHGISEEYRCYIRGRDPSERLTIYVTPAQATSIDSPDAFDSAAHAALSFAAEEPSGSFVSEQADMTDTGWRIVRRWRANGVWVHRRATKGAEL